MRVLLTGFEPYGGRGRNPSAEIASRLNGERIAECEIIAYTLPVALDPLAHRIRQLLQETDPVLVVSLGLAPGTPVIRIERVAVNRADFEIPDNDGALCADKAIVDEGPAALLSTLPIHAIKQCLLEAGIPAQISDSAGTYLCNAIMYQFLHRLSAQSKNKNIPSGFIHLPYLPAQVAEIIAGTQKARGIELHQRSDLASMDLEVMIEAVQLVIQTSLAHV